MTSGKKVTLDFEVPEDGLYYMNFDYLSYDESILPVSSMIHGIYGIDDVVLSMPAIVGKDGVETLVPISMSSDEVEKLKDSAKTLKEVLEQTK